ncbi:MAG TPA: hypothetical protein VEW48_25390 [Thermoanaerobaculia bacterium]|nr:hypothetical protein [Thermoanaerobaculia bacterium]
MNRLTAALVFALLLGGWASASMADPGRGSSVQCYIWANDPSSTIGTAYTPSTIYSYNAVGRSAGNTVTRTGTGTYSVTCKGVGGGALFSGSGTWSFGGHVQVTAYGSEDADFCKVQSWSTGGPDFTATVRCYNRTGVLSDNRFDLLFLW